MCRAADALDQSAQLVGDGLVYLPGGVLVDQRRAETVLAHPRHEIFGADVSLRGERVPRMPEVMEMQTEPTDASDRVFPPGEQIPVTAANRIPPLSGEHPGVRMVPHLLVQMFDDRGPDRFR